MNLAKLLVQRLHLLRVRRRIPAVLAVFLLCSITQVSTHALHSTHQSPVLYFLCLAAHTLRPSLIRNRVRDRQTVCPVDQARHKDGGKRHRNIPSVRLVQQCPLDPAGGNTAARVCKSHGDGQKRLQSEVGREDGALESGELGAFEGLEGGRCVYKGLVDASWHI